MSRTPRFFTPEQIHKRIKSGRGQGMGKDYQPWLTIQDV
ncbi:heteromeric transposase endonuclease subunit TnsA, partial [Acinetobacter baumannii]